MKDFLLVGVTGGAGSGKTTACKFLKALGYAVIDADRIGHDIDASAEFYNAFGASALDPHTRRTNRRYLRELLVSDPAAKEKIEAIMAPKITAKIRNLVDAFKNHGFKLAFIDSALLFESGFHGNCDYIVCLLADHETRVNRVMERDHFSRENTVGLFQLQMPDADKARMSDLTIINDGTIQKLYSDVAVFLSVLHMRLISEVSFH